MSLGPLHEALTVCAGITLGYQLFFYAIAATMKFDKVTDLAGGSNFVILSLFTFFHYNKMSNVHDRQIVLTTMTTVWGLRTSLFLFYRVLRFETDRRFDKMRDSPLAFLVFWVLQMLWVWLVSLPVIYVNTVSSDKALNWQDYLGIAVAGCGWLVETVSDQHKLFYKLSDKGQRWCTVGFWKYSRHPNYFGEIVFWWGIFIIASRIFTSSVNGGYFTIVGPLFITWLLLMLSGIPILEKTANRRYGSSDAYLEYRECTSPLIPLPRSLYRALPASVKATLLFEWPMYAQGLPRGEDQQ